MGHMDVYSGPWGTCVPSSSPSSSSSSSSSHALADSPSVPCVQIVKPSEAYSSFVILCYIIIIIIPAAVYLSYANNMIVLWPLTLTSRHMSEHKIIICEIFYCDFFPHVSCRCTNTTKSFSFLHVKLIFCDEVKSELFIYLSYLKNASTVTTESRACLSTDSDANVQQLTHHICSTSHNNIHAYFTFIYCIHTLFLYDDVPVHLCVVCTSFLFHMRVKKMK